MRGRALLPVFVLATLAAPVLPLPGDAARRGTAVAQVPNHNCAFCHNLHGASFTTLSDFPTSEALCVSCHGDAGPAQVDRDGTLVDVPKNVEIHDGTKHTQATSCWNCHDHEGEAVTNLSMIPRQRTGAALGATRELLFTARTGAKSFADGDTIYDGVCEVCHTLTDHHRHDGSVDRQHNAQADCTVCHDHDTGFQPSGGGCTGCHSSAQDNGDGTPPGGRRPIVSEFGRTAHHIDWAGAGLAAADSIPDTDCQVCHDQSQHQQGQVRLWDVDAPGDTSATVKLAGDPASSSTEAGKLTAFCLSCHDSDGAGGDTTPFSDNVAVPAIDATAWTGASHNATGTLSCYGNGTFGCHASGHGSQKRRLLAPPDVAATAPALAEEQEGFCLNCHDSDGPALSDIATDFNRPIRWVQLATGLNSNPKLNDRHDIQFAAQDSSGAVIECTSCHDPHRATSGLPYILDPDPNDGHVVGTNWYFSAYQTANDTLSEFCLDCHDGSFPPGVQGHASPTIVNIRTTWVNDGMGGRTSSSTDLRSGTGWVAGDVLPCGVCHTAHVRYDVDQASTTLFSVVDTVFNKAGDTPLFFQDRKASDPQIFAYGITNNQSTADATSGGYWCNTCHNRYAMTGKTNCYSCHRHGDGGRW